MLSVCVFNELVDARAKLGEQEENRVCPLFKRTHNSNAIYVYSRLILS